MLEQLTSEQISEWQAYDQLDPMGEVREDIRHSRLLSLIANLFKARFGKKSTKMSKPLDFMPQWYEEPEYQVVDENSVDQAKSLFKSIATVFGKKNKKKGE
ncbi:MAG: DUF4035 domain-containing protein [Bacteroidales bacterium]